MVRALGPAVLLVAGLGGLAVPWFLHRSGRAHPAGSVGACFRAAGAGVVLGIALLHCLPEGAAALDCAGWQGPEYPWAFLLAAVAAAGAALVEGAAVDAARHRTCSYVGGACARPGHATTKAGGEDPAAAEAGALTATATTAVSPPLTAASVRSHAHGPGAPPPAFHAASIAVLEVGIAAHSLVVGFALGAAETGCAALPLLAAFAVHQALEGAAVGSCLADCALPRAVVAASAAVTALSAPAGAVAGLVARGPIARAESAGAAGLSLSIFGVADALAAGLLLHVGLADLLAADVGVGLRGVAGPVTRGARARAHALFAASLAFGLGVAALLAVWG